MSFKITDKDTGYRDFMNRMAKLSGGKVVDVGIFAESGQDIVNRAVWNEFGTATAPARPFLNTALEVYRSEMVTTADRVAKGVVDGKLEVEQALAIMGQKAQTLVRRRIVELDSPPNAPSTIAKKGSDNPLVDSGEMGRAVNYKVR